MNKLIIFRKEGAQFFHGNYQDFLTKIGWEEEVRHTTKPKVKPAEKVETPVKNPQVNQLKMEEVENEILKLEDLLEKYNNLMVKKAGSGEDITEISMTVKKIEEKIEEKFSDLEKLQE